jgi:hypothetical protein
MNNFTRRRFAFYVGFGLFGLSERLRASALDELAAATMKLASPVSEAPQENELSVDEGRQEHWTAAENSDWRWFERENFVDGDWRLTGITTPINKQSGEPYMGETGYLDESLVPQRLREQRTNHEPHDVQYEADSDEEGHPNSERRARHGRPPSKWLRSLTADELRLWLKKIEVPEAGVSGMTFETHLTRDHSFSAENIQGLSEEEQAKLHAAAHYGY